MNRLTTQPQISVASLDSSRQICCWATKEQLWSWHTFPPRILVNFSMKLNLTNIQQYDELWESKNQLYLTPDLQEVKVRLQGSRKSRDGIIIKISHSNMKCLMYQQRSTTEGPGKDTSKEFVEAQSSRGECIHRGSNKSQAKDRTDLF